MTKEEALAKHEFGERVCPVCGFELEEDEHYYWCEQCGFDKQYYLIEEWSPDGEWSGEFNEDEFDEHGWRLDFALFKGEDDSYWIRKEEIKINGSGYEDYYPTTLEEWNEIISGE